MGLVKSEDRGPKTKSTNIFLTGLSLLVESVVWSICLLTWSVGHGGGSVMDGVLLSEDFSF